MTWETLLCGCGHARWSHASEEPLLGCHTGPCRLCDCMWFIDWLGVPYINSPGTLTVVIRHGGDILRPSSSPSE